MICWLPIRLINEAYSQGFEVLTVPHLPRGFMCVFSEAI